MNRNIWRESGTCRIVGLRKSLKKITFSDYKTVSENFLVDDQSNLWVRTHETKQEQDKSYVAYDIFNQDGFYDVRVWIDLYPQVISKGKMYLIDIDKETDLRMVKRYLVVWSDEK
jgi:hypothetical protein